MTKNPFSQLARWSVRFTLVQCVFFYLVCFKYPYSLFPLDLPFISSHDKIRVVNFIIITYIGHFALLATFWILLPCLLAAALFRRPSLVLPIGWLVAYLAVVFFLLDGQLYSLYRAHINATYLHMVFGGHASDLLNLSGLEWATLIFGALGIGFLQAVLVRMVWRWNSNPMGTLTWLICLLSMMLISYALYFKSVSRNRNEITIQTKSFPYYQRIVTAWLPKKLGVNKLRNWGSGYFTQAKQIDAPLNYPIHPLQCGKNQNRPNVLMIVVDTWRPDSLTAKIMPNTFALRKNAINFQDHLSGGNGTQPGMFSLFYGIPSSYFEAMLKYQTAPAVLQEAKAQGYDIGMFVSATSKIPNFRSTIYANANIRYDSPSSKDAAFRDFHVTARTKEWIIKDRQKPFFGLAFYDIAHAYCETPFLKVPFADGVPECNRLSWNRSSNPIPYLHRYQNMLHYADGQIQELINTLKKRGLDKNTIVVITADHGQEFNDNKRNYWEHANNFTKFQVNVPFLILWPGKKPETITYRTDHYDLSTTLLQDVFSCTNKTTDYSIGKNLFDPAKRDAVLIGSYINNAVVEPNKITILWGDGEIEVQAPDTRPLPDDKPDVKLVAHALLEMRRFYKP